MTTRTVPAALAGVLTAGREDLADRIRPYGRRVGARVEVDLDDLARAEPTLAAALTRLADDTAHLWAGTGGAYVTTTRVVADHRQVTGRTGRADLTDVFEDLCQMSATRALLEELTAPDPDTATLGALTSGAGGDLGRRDDGAWEATVPLDGAVCWPDSLGGPPYLTEVARRVTLVARHAAWRDRRTRRLAQVVVTVEEMWADPGPALALLD